VALLELRLRARPEAVGRARNALSALAAHLPGTLVYDLRLMVSELVTNCLRHGGLAPGDPIQMTVESGDDRVRVEVVSPGRGFRPPRTPPTIYSTSGWGLFLVSRLADRWGVDARGGTRVWLEVDLPSERGIRAG
jgi:anti-sigma regulatory factor (Ser/Thr protein kinase)